MPQETKQDARNHSSETQTLHGTAITSEDERALIDGLEKAFDYRGDVTIELMSGAKVDGYIFDRVCGSTLASSYVRVMEAQTGEKKRVSFAEISKLAFSGRDMAHGKSFETWVNKFIEKKLKGEKASIESESLD